ncbi:PadR family transcriptional regulator [Actinomadura montaniterrae]|uniref:PadR family transcriptional regulator n=1 Tax=Actinomadura montaniterrae TaxID=1803903 RepID=A0A6L3VPB2_9ACTN|nr:helix-turn-helix transcriptional regulator [Actinomadura montaniterrae]KAB2376990.1 PadR family transcriptional regulator [Actinomadura montaniterrae]
MSGIERVTRPLLDVLEEFFQAHLRGEELHGWALVHSTKRAGPTVYRVLDRLEDAGWVAGRWEQHNPDPSRPRRRFYQLTGVGVTEARLLLGERRPRALQPAARPLPGTAAGGWSLRRAEGR